MTITQSLRDDNAASGSITDAIDKLALAMAGGFRSVSTRQNTDSTGRIVKQTVFTEEGTAVSVKRSERNTAGGVKEGTGGTAIQYDGLYWVINGSFGAHTLSFIFEVDDDEKVVIKITANNTEAGVGDDIVIENVTLGGQVSIAITSIVDTYTFIGLPGESYKVTFETGGVMNASSNGTLTVDYMPELTQALEGEKFNPAWGESPIPSYFQSYVPKLLPTAAISRGGSGLVMNTTFSFAFPNGLRPWFPYTSDFVHRVALVVKFVGVDISINMPVTSMSISIMGYNSFPGLGEALDISGQWTGIVGSGLWPAMVGYFQVDTDWANTWPAIVRLVVNHTAGVYFPSVPTLGYFIVEGRT